MTLVYHFNAVGFLFPPHRAPISDPAEYDDLRRLRWTQYELRLDLEHANLPAGLIIQLEGGLPGVVVEDPAGGQMIKPLQEILMM